MKTKLILTVSCLFLLAGVTFGQTASFSLVDSSNSTSGTYNPNDTFTLTLNGTWTGFTANNFSLWLETNTTLAPHITITGETYTLFTDQQDNGFPKAFTSTAGATSSSFLTDTDTVVNPKTGTIDSGDLGASGAGSPSGTFQLATISFQLSGAPAGVYSLITTDGSSVPPGKRSEIGDSNTAVGAAADTYSITVVPEPATLSLLALSGLGSFGLSVLRRHRRN